MNCTFGEKKEEWNGSENIPVWLSPKYLESKEKAIEILGKYKSLRESDFWILMNETKTKKMGYSGLIISHNGCLKINDELDLKDRFKPSCVEVNQSGYEDSLVFTYKNEEQGIYEVGEISISNYKQKIGRYPYAMGFKRLFDRVVLKISKLAYAGIYSDSEADEFSEVNNTSKIKDEIKELTEKATKEQIAKIQETRTEEDIDKALEYYGAGCLEILTKTQADIIIKRAENKK